MVTTALNYFEVIQRVHRILGRPVPSTFADLTNEFQLNIKSLVNQVNKDVLMAFTYACRERTMSLSIGAEAVAKYTAITNTIPGEVAKDSEGRALIYDTTNGGYYTYSPDKAEFLLGESGACEYTFRNNKILFTANSTARTLTVEYYTNKLALDATTYENFVEGTTTQKDELALETDYSILPGFLHEPVLVYGTCFYYEAQKNESAKTPAFKERFQEGIRQLNAHNRDEGEEFQFMMGNLHHDIRRSAV
jgi:sulfur carrier protein ThiS